MIILRPVPRVFGIGVLSVALGLLAGSVKAPAQLVPSRTSQTSNTGENPATEVGGQDDSVFAGRQQGGAALRRSAHELYLSELSEILSSSSKPLELHLVFPGTEELSIREIQFGAAISQALALRTGYRPVLVSRGTQPRAGKFNVLLGTENELAASLSESERKRIQNGYLSLRRIGSGPDDLLLTVSGKTSDKVADAIISLGLLREKFPDASHASIREVVVPENAPFMRRAPLVPGETYTFEQLREAGAVTEVSSAAGVTMELFIPGYIATDSESPVSINLQYEQRRQTFGSSQSAQVVVNGRVVKPSRVARGAGEEIELQFPFNWLRPGRNSLQIHDGTGVQATRLKIYGESTLSLPSVDKHPALPDLQLTARTFYPFVGEPSGRDVSVVLGSLDVQTIESAWTFLARLAQSANTFFFRSTFAVGELDPSRHNLIIGEYNHLPKEAQETVALEAFREEHANTPVSQIGQISRGTNLKMLIERWVKGPQNQNTADAAAPQKVHPAQGDALLKDEWAVLASAPSRHDPQLWNLVLTSPSTTNLRERAFDVVLPEFWDAIRGDIVLWENAPNTLRAHLPGEHKSIAANNTYVEFPTGDRLRVSVWVWSVLGVLFLFVIASSWVLGKCDQAVVMRQRKPR